MPLGPDDRTTLGAAEVGQRVVVRRRVAGPDGRDRYADVLGDLLAADDRSLVVRRRDGQVVRVEVGDVVAAKPIPPPPERWPGALELERIAAKGWSGLEQEHLGEWLLRASDGFTGRANSLLPVGDPGLPLVTALEQVVGWYAARGLPPLAQVPLPLAADVDRALAAHDWRAFNPTTFLVGRLEDLLGAGPTSSALPPVRHAPRPDQAWLAGYHYRGRALPDGAVRVLTQGADLTFASAGADDDEPWGVARGCVDDGWLGVTAVTVAPRHRRQGVARHLMRGVAEWARLRGATRVYLQVAEDNAPALGLYAGLGLHPHHRYHYRTPRGLSRATP